MAIEIGSIVEGEVSGIMAFGAFVTLKDNKVGLVHISEVSSTYVSDINEHLKVGDHVKVKVIKIDDNGKISLSIKKAMDKPAEPKQKQKVSKQNTPIRPADIDWGAKSTEGMSLDDMINKFKQDSDEKMLALKRSNESKRSGGYRRGSNSY